MTHYCAPDGTRIAGIRNTDRQVWRLRNVWRETIITWPKPHELPYQEDEAPRGKVAQERYLDMVVFVDETGAEWFAHHLITSDKDALPAEACAVMCSEVLWAKRAQLASDLKDTFESRHVDQFGLSAMVVTMERTAQQLRTVGQNFREGIPLPGSAEALARHGVTGEGMPKAALRAVDVDQEDEARVSAAMREAYSARIIVGDLGRPVPGDLGIPEPECPTLAMVKAEAYLMQRQLKMRAGDETIAPDSDGAFIVRLADALAGLVERLETIHGTA